ncbi:hypothetical protein E6W39_29270 [Kitasatospora acidiphila]|uniref:Uncharacterized protein n=1 Tax=Kitasatospora acidiphila TaxID=2567942 RepID=A0A540W969_9ACTN|nr:hypothetical protein [Kitasatospora acidiphila]TQF05576.1 hypothetical protein E6W39_29270 [Kitasatospora acidiphila]
MNIYLSLVRTGIPALVGWLVALAAGYGLNLDPAALAGVLAPLAGFAYYGLFRIAEEHLSPRFGWLLGYARPPHYAAQIESASS